MNYHLGYYGSALGVQGGEAAAATAVGNTGYPDL